MIKKEFFKNVLPSMIAFAFTGVYSIVDGFFVGRNIGDAGLAGINIAYPLVALMQAAGTGLGMAGAVQIAINKGKNDHEKEKRYLGNTLVLLLMAGIFITALLFFIYKPALQAFGASGLILKYAQQYMRIAIAGSLMQILATGLIPIIRNYNGALMAMVSMACGFLSNIFLDWLFVSKFQYGMTGAAVATLIGQIITIIPCSIFLLKKIHLLSYATFPLRKDFVKYIMAIAVSPFGLTLSPNIVILIINKGAVSYGGELAVSCYAVVSYVICVVQLLLQGIGDGSQPLIGRYYGRSDIKSMWGVRKLGYLFAFAVAIVSSAAIYLAGGNLAHVFGVSPEVEKMYGTVILFFISGLIFAALLRITTAYFYAAEKNKYAYILIYGEPLLLAMLSAFVLPRIFGLNGVWAAPPVTQACIAIAALFLIKKLDKKGHTEIQLEHITE